MASVSVRMQVRGAEKFAALSKRLKHAPLDTRREFFRALNSATKGIRGDIKTRTPEFLPDVYAGVFTPDLKLSTTRRASGAGVGVRIRAKSKRNIRRPETGFIRHPLFGNRKHWFTTKTNKPHFFSEPAEEGADDARVKLLEAMDRIADKIEG